MNNSTKIAKTIEYLDSLKMPFCGTVISDKSKKYHISPFEKISISGVGPVFYINSKNQKIYTVLQRRFKDNFQWLFCGGYVEVPPTIEQNQGIKLPPFDKLKEVTMKNAYQKMAKNGWQKVKKEMNDADGIKKIFKKHQIKWPKEFDANLQSAWQREVLEEVGIDLSKFPKKTIVDFKLNKTLMMGAEPDRLTNIDATFAAMLGSFDQAPKIKSGEETEIVEWIAIEDIEFDEKKSGYFAKEIHINPYTISLIEEGLFKLLCAEIKKISAITNQFNKQKISRFNDVQNIQSFLIKISNSLDIDLDQFKEICRFLSWQFGELEIAKNICGKSGDWFYKASITICDFLSNQEIKSPADLKILNQKLQKIK